MAAGERRPNDSVTGNVESARREPLNGRLRIVPRQFVNFRDRGLRRIRTRNDPDDGPGEAEDASPNRTVRRIHGYAVEGSGDPLILGWIDGLIWFDISVAFTISIRVQDESRPPLRFLLIARFVKHLHVQPTNDVTPAAA